MIPLELGSPSMWPEWLNAILERTKYDAASHLVSREARAIETQAEHERHAEHDR